MNAAGVLLNLLIIVVLITLMLWYVNRCRHIWELVDKTEFPSMIEEYAKRGVKMDIEFFSTHAVIQLGVKRIALVLRCSQCGKAMIKKIDSGP